MSVFLVCLSITFSVGVVLAIVFIEVQQRQEAKQQRIQEAKRARMRMRDTYVHRALSPNDFPQPGGTFTQPGIEEWLDNDQCYPPDCDGYYPIAVGVFVGLDNQGMVVPLTSDRAAGPVGVITQIREDGTVIVQLIGGVA